MTRRARALRGIALALAAACTVAACGVYGPPRRPEPPDPAHATPEAEAGERAPGPGAEEDPADGR